MYRKISIYALFLLLTSVSVLFLFTEKQTISINEKRKLAEFPGFSPDSYFNGNYTRSIDQFINDHFPFRQSAVRLTETFRDHMGFRINNKEKIIVVNYQMEEKPEKPVAFQHTDSLGNTKPENEAPEEKDTDPAASMMVLNGRVYPLHIGCPSMSPVFARMINEYGDTLKEKTRIFTCVVPLSSAFIPDIKYERYKKSNKETLDAIRDALSPNVYYCDVFGELNRRMHENLWFGSDHHWTALGAYYGYVAFCKAAGIDPAALSEMERKVRYPFLGSLYDLTRDKSVRENPDSVVVYIPNVQTEAKRYNHDDFDNPEETSVFCNSRNYTAFLCGDAPLIRISTNINNNKRAAIVKNSMGNALAVYLINHYEEIYVFDFRYSRHNILKVIEEAEIDDLVFAIGMYGAMNHGTINMMRNMARHKVRDYNIAGKQKHDSFLDSLCILQDSLPLVSEPHLLNITPKIQTSAPGIIMNGTTSREKTGKNMNHYRNQE